MQTLTLLSPSYTLKASLVRRRSREPEIQIEEFKRNTYTSAGIVSLGHSIGDMKGCIVAQEAVAKGVSEDTLISHARGALLSIPTSSCSAIEGVQSQHVVSTLFF